MNKKKEYSVSMITFLKSFLILISLYFLLNTIIVFGFFDGQHQVLISSIKDIIWVGWIGYNLIYNRATTKSYIKQTQWQVIILSAMALIGVVVTRYSNSNLTLFIKNSIIGLKYGRYFMFIFWSAGLLGFQEAKRLKSEETKTAINGWIAFVVRLSWFILVGGLAIQGSKILWPELWHALGFGGLDMYRAGVAPPLYYLTKQDGVMRYSGLFSGPNNFAFWLIAVTPLLRSYSNRIQKIGLGIFGVLNLGRVVLVGWITETIQRFISSKVKSKLLLFSFLALTLALASLITYLKRESTIQHFTLGIDTLHKFWINPRGYGLGSSGPGVHWNGSLLPENYYLQLALDYGFLGPVCFGLFWYFTLRAKKLKSEEAKTDQTIENLFISGFIGMLVAGLFLHVFEDSMVNYLFFVSWGFASQITDN